MNEKIIVTMTTWEKRIHNIPTVLDTIYAQTLLPDKVIINLAFDEVIPKDIKDYIDKHDIEIFRVPDTKVFKKLIPTLRRYPNDCIIAIDDDWLYPNGMIEDFMNVHKHYPDNPISGNHAVNFGLQCHCGCASLVKARFFGPYLDCIDDELITNCPSDDIVYTYFANKAGFPYIRTKGYYSINMLPYGNENSYSSLVVNDNGIGDSFNYMIKRYGKLSNSFLSYVNDHHIAELLYDIQIKSMDRSYEEGKKKGSQLIHSTLAYKIGYFMVLPFSSIKRIIEIIYKKQNKLSQIA
jgi:hypothetical protein